MNCMKCGREFEGDQAFCPACLETMSQYPVKSDVVVTLPKRTDSVPKKTSIRRKIRTPEEQIERLKRKNRRLTILLCLVSVIALLLGCLAVGVLRELDVQRFLGKNFTTVETAGQQE